MKQYAIDNAEKSGLQSPSSSLRIVHGVAEALPFADASVDAVVVTLTLCSVTNPERAVSEIKRVLKPGGIFVFWEHVLSEKDGGLALQQQILSPIQTFVADGCHLNRRTGSIIANAGFRGGVDLRYTTMTSVDIIGPTVYGVAIA
jgi:SAM-dependent methyltransferase